MDWLKPALLAALVICSSAQPLDQELGVNLEEEEMSNMVADSEDDLEEDEVTGLTTTDPQEIGRFNNYMDAIYRRMNAALRAKLMDPMVLNMNQKKDDDKKKSKKKNRVERSADLEEDEEKDEVELVDLEVHEEDVDRMGEAEAAMQKKKKKEGRKHKNKKGGKDGEKKKKKNRKGGKNKGKEGKMSHEERMKKREEKKKEREEKRKAKKLAKKRVERSADDADDNAEAGSVLRRMNAALRTKLMDPMVTENIEVDRMGLAEEKNTKKTNAKKAKSKSRKEGKKGDKKKKEKVMTEARKKKRADRKKARQEKKKAAKEAAKAAEEENEEVDEDNAEKELDEEEGASRESRSRKNKGKKGGKKGGNKGGNKGKAGKALNKKGGKGGNKGGKKGGKGGQKGRSQKSEAETKSMGSLAGIATLRRSGDVKVVDEESHKTVTSKFTVGPLQLEVSKTYGHGKERTIKTAKASTDVMSGIMVLKVKPDGSAHVKKVVFQKPEQVDVLGSISDQKKRSDTYLKNSVNKMRPIAAQKILKTARYVLKAPGTVERKN